MEIAEFTPVRGQGFIFDKVFKIYDAQFETLRSCILSLGDKLITETFTGNKDTVLTTKENFHKGSIVVYKNDNILWDDEDYTVDETYNQIHLLVDRTRDDVFRVMILHSNFLQTSINTYVQDLEKQVGKSSDTYNKASYLKSLLTEMEQRLDQKIEEYNKDKEDVEDAFTGLNERISDTLNYYADIQDMKVSVEACYKKVVDIQNAIEALSGLTPTELVDNEVVLARSGAATLGTRLDSLLYTFKSSDDLKSCLYLKDGDRCQFVDRDNGIKIYQVINTLDGVDEDIPSFKLANGLFAYQVATSFDTMPAIKIEEVEVSPTNIVEMGQSITTVFIRWRTNTPAYRVTLDSTKLKPDGKSIIGESEVDVNLTDNTVAKLTVTSSAGYSDEYDLKFYFSTPYYYGTSSVEDITDSDYINTKLTRVLDYDGKVKFDVDAGNDEYIYLVIPKTFVVDLYQDAWKGGFNDPVVINHVNSSGHEEEYLIYRSTYPNLGKVTVEALGDIPSPVFNEVNIKDLVVKNYNDYFVELSKQYNKMQSDIADFTSYMKDLTSTFTKNITDRQDSFENKVNNDFTTYTTDTTNKVDDSIASMTSSVNDNIDKNNKKVQDEIEYMNDTLNDLSRNLDEKYHAQMDSLNSIINKHVKDCDKKINKYTTEYKNAINSFTADMEARQVAFEETITERQDNLENDVRDNLVKVRDHSYKKAEVKKSGKVLKLFDDEGMGIPKLKIVVGGEAS